MSNINPQTNKKKKTSITCTPSVSFHKDQAGQKLLIKLTAKIIVINTNTILTNVIIILTCEIPSRPSWGDGG